MKTIITNLLLFQIGWLGCVLAGANQLPWLGTTIALLIVASHVINAADSRKESALILITACIGATWDSLLVYGGFLQYPSGTLVEGTAPHWIVAMWMLFATTFNVSLKWLKQRLALAAVLGAVSGPAAYFAGHKLGGVQFPDTAMALAVLACGWALLLPLLMSISNRLDGIKRQASLSRLTGWNTGV